MTSHETYTSTKTLELFLRINSYTNIMGLLNVWDKARRPAISKNLCYIIFHKLMNISLYWMMLLQMAGVLKHKTYDAKQKSDWILLIIAHPLLYSAYVCVQYYKENVKELLFRLVVMLKDDYNDEMVEQRMIRKSKMYMAAYLLLCCLSLVLYGFDSLLQVIRSGHTFVTVVTAWPDFDDTSGLAAIARVAIYIVWWTLMLRSTNGYILATSTTICLSYQFRNLHSYFYGLDDIFKGEELSQQQKEEKYENALKVGIKMHSDTLWCTRHCQIVYGIVYSGQIVISLTGLALLMVQMVNAERTIVNAFPILATASTILVTTGIFMWNAGDVTVEKPVIIRGCAIMDLSYQSYVSIVKSSYSVFSFIY